MNKKLEQYFGCKVKITEYNQKLALPIFMTMRKIYLVEIFNVEFAIVDISNEVELTIAAMKKQKAKYEEVLQCPIVYDMKINSLSMRNALVKNGISFVDLPENLFIPFIGVVLKDVYRKQVIRTDKMMPTTQMVFLKLLYMEDEESILKSDIASELNLTRTSVTRATVQLREMGLICEQKSGTEINVKRRYSRRACYDKAKEYLINPVQKIVASVKDEKTIELLNAGETALSLFSELNPPVLEEKAVYKGDEIVEQFVSVDTRYEDWDKCLKIQLWKYNPWYFAVDGCVDPVSLACTFIGTEDERIEMGIEELLEEL